MRFITARLMRDEDLLATLSVPQPDLLATLAGKTVALVGNARALTNSRHGQDIDAHDVVVRVNLAPMPYVESHGARTDWLGLAVRLPGRDRARIEPGRILWMSHKRKRLDYLSARSKGFYLHPLDDYEALKDQLGAQPTTGAMLIELLLRSDLARLDLYGFDFFASQSLTGSRSAEQVPHDFSAEAAWVEDLLNTDPRLSLHRPHN
ncbi:glycosyltransferase family 29 protein [Paracoccus xiamenensis]|uniref:glycosyltransferase family 29 protein n=1 Tax=Paracoccus xiamenensis TaxID=2714901 RepID=UPI0038B3867F